MSADEIEVRVDIAPEIADLTMAMMAHVVEFYRDGEPSRERVYLLLNALAMVAATVIVGCEPELYKWFGDAVMKNMRLIVDQVPERSGVVLQ